jgi:hypothetical protein
MAGLYTGNGARSKINMAKIRDKIDLYQGSVTELVQAVDMKQEDLPDVHISRKIHHIQSGFFLKLAGGWRCGGFSFSCHKQKGKTMTILKKLAVVSVGVLALTGTALASSGVYGGWAVDKNDCKYVNTRQGVIRDVTAGIITRHKIYFYNAECEVSSLHKKGKQYFFEGTCYEGNDPPYSESLRVILKNNNVIRAKWPEIGWTTFRRCWNLPK